MTTTPTEYVYRPVQRPPQADVHPKKNYDIVNELVQPLLQMNLEEVCVTTDTHICQVERRDDGMTIVLQERKSKCTYTNRLGDPCPKPWAGAEVNRCEDHMDLKQFYPKAPALARTARTQPRVEHQCYGETKSGAPCRISIKDPNQMFCRMHRDKQDFRRNKTDFRGTPARNNTLFKE